MEDFLAKVSAGTIAWGLSAAAVAALLKGLSVLVNRLMDRKLKQDEYVRDNAKEATKRLWTKLDEKDSKVTALNNELDEVYSKYHESLTSLEGQTIRLEHCREDVKNLGSEIRYLTTEIERLNALILDSNQQDLGP